MCINWKVIGGLAVAAIGLYLVVPSVFLSALPLLLIAACPLSMLFMAKTMTGGQGAAASSAHAAQPTEAPPNDAEQMAQLQAQLRGAQEQQAMLARRLAVLEATAAMPLPDAAPPDSALPHAAAQADRAIQPTRQSVAEPAWTTRDLLGPIAVSTAAETRRPAAPDVRSHS